MTDELKPCPFCGGEAACIEETAWVIGCFNGQCAAAPSVWEPSKEMAIAAWNTRADLAATPLDDPRVFGLVKKARAVVDRWDSPLWKNLSHTGESIADLRAALSALEKNK